MADRKLDIIISGDAKKALAAFTEAGGGAEGLKSKLGGVGGIAAATGVAVAASAVGIGVALFKVGESFQEQYNKISTGTGATGKALDALKTNFKDVAKDVPDSFGKVGDAITVVSQKLGLTGKPLEEVSKQFLDLSRITKTDLTANIQAATGVFNQFKIKGEEQKNTLDELYRASQASGVGFGDLTAQVSGSANVFQALGFNVEQATTVVAGLGKEGLSTADVIPALTKVLGVAAKTGKNAQTVYQDLIGAIKKAPSDVAASKIAFDELGAKAGPKFAALVRSGKFAFDNLGESIAEGSDTIDKGAKRAETFGEKWDIIKNRVLVGLEPLATGVFNGMGAAMDHLGPVIDTLTSGLSRIGDFISANKPEFEALAAVIGGVLTAAFVAWGIQAGISAATSAAAFVATQLQAGISAAATVASIGLVIAGWVAQGVAATASGAAMAAAWLVGLGPIGLVVAAVAGAAALIVTHWDTIKNAALAVWNWISTNWPLILAILTGPIGLAVLAITRNWDTIKSGFTAVKDWIGDRVNDIVGFFASLPGRITGAVKGMWNGIKAEFKATIDAVIGAWNNLHIPSFHVHITMPSAIPNIDFDTPEIDFPNIPYLHSGGIFQSGQGEGFAWLKDGEGVFTPGQMAAMNPARGSGAAPRSIEVHLHMEGATVVEGVGALAQAVRQEFEQVNFRNYGIVS